MRLPATQLLLLFLLAGAAYAPGLTGGFVFDDYYNIVDNRALRPADLTLQTLLEAVVSSPSGPSRRPVSSLSFLLNYALFGDSVLAFKLVNLAIHILNAGLLLVLCRRLLAHLTTVGTKMQERAALLAASLWTVHPLNLTSVLYVVQRMNSLAACFSLLAMLLYLRIREHSVATGEAASRRAWLALVLVGALAFGSKENAILLPLSLFLIEVMCFRFRQAAGLRWGFLAIALIGLAGLAYLVFWREILTSGYAHRPFTAWERGLTESRVMAHYLKQILLPDPFSMALLHSDWQLSTGLLHPPSTLAAALLHGGLLGLAWSLRRRHAVPAFGIAWFYLWHLLESTVFPLELVYEHRNYLASAGLILAVAFALLTLPRATRSSVAVISVGLVLVLGSMTFYRAWRWGDVFTLALLEREHNPGSERAAYEYSRVLLSAYLQSRQPELLAEGRATLQDLVAHDKAGPLVLIGLMNSYLIAKEEVPPALVEKFSASLAEGAPDAGHISAFEMLTACQTPPGPCRLAPEVIVSPAGAVLGNDSAPAATKALVLERLALYYANALNDLPAATRAAEGARSYLPGEALYRLRLAEILLAAGDLAAARREVAQADAMVVDGSARLRPLWVSRRSTLERKLARAMAPAHP